MKPGDNTPLPTGQGPVQPALQGALAGLMASVARLAVARGLPCAAVEEMLRLAFVQAAARAHPGLPEHRKVSRIATSTGIHRREVTRLVQAVQQAAQQATQQATQQAQATEQGRAHPAPRARSVASEVFTHWRAQPPYRGADGEPVALPRQGPAPSFETLAQAVTRDVHPRSLLDELCRLGLAQWDAAADTVRLLRDGFVAHGDLARQINFLGDNVGDHLRAAVANVIDGDDHAHFEQAVFAEGLSAASIASVRPAVRAQWQALLQALVPALEARVEADAALQPAPRGRLRIGLYTYHEGAEAAPSPPPREPLRARIKPVRQTKAAR